MAYVGNVVARIGANIKPLQKGLKDAQKNLGQFENSAGKSVTSAQKKIQSNMQQSNSKISASMALAKNAMLAAATAITLATAYIAKNTTQMAMEVQASMQQLSRILGANAGDFIKWANTQANAFNMSKGEAIKYGATYANLLTSVTKDQTKLSDYTVQLLKATAIVASATGRDFQDTAERIRSGILGNTESIEDLGINVNIAMIESTNAFKKFANGKSWQQLNFQTQQQIRLFAILEQSAFKYGSEISNNTSSSVARLSSIIKDIALNIGQAFLPIIDIMLPKLEAFAQRIKVLSQYFSEFSRAIFGQTNQQNKAVSSSTNAAKAQSDLGKATKKAGTEAKKSVAGFDEVNQLQESIADNADDAAESLSQNSASVSPTTGIGDEPISPGVIQAVDNFKTKITELKQSISDFYNEWGIKDIFEGIKKGLNTFDFTTMQNNFSDGTSKLKFSIDKILDIAKESINNKKPLIVEAATKVFESVAKAGQTIGEILSDAYKIYMDKIMKFILENKPLINKALEGILNTYATGLIVMAGITNGILDVIKGAWDNWGKNIFTKIVDIFANIGNWFLQFFTTFLLPIFDRVLGWIHKIWQDNLKGIFDEVSGFIGRLATIVIGIYDYFIKPFIDYFIKNLLPIITNVVITLIDILGNIVNGALAIVKNFIKILNGFLDIIIGVFTLNWSKAWEGVKSIVIAVFDSIWESIKTIINSIISLVNSFIRQLNRISFTNPFTKEKVSFNVQEIDPLGGISPTSIGTKKIDPIKNDSMNIDESSLGLTSLKNLWSNMKTTIGTPSRPELILPKNTEYATSNLADVNSTDTASALQSLAQALNFMLNTNKQGETVSTSTEAGIYIDGTLLARAIMPAIEKERQRIGNTAIISVT